MAEGDELSTGLRVDSRDSRYADASCAVCGALWRRSHALLVPPIAKKIVLRSQELPAARSPLCLTGEEKCSGVKSLCYANRSVTAARRATICEEKCYDGTARTRCIGCYDGTARAVPISFFQNNTGTCSECSGATPIQIVSCHTRTRLPRVSANALARLSQRPRRGGASGGTCRGHPHPRERCGSLPMPLTPTTP